jgi:type I restriction enzyme S subunit
VIGGLKPYAAMKDSGVSWLGQIPATWDVRRFKYLARERDDRSQAGTEQLLRVSQYTGVTERKRTDELEGPDTRASSLVGYKRVSPSDLVVNIMLAWNGSMGVSPFDGICSPAYCVYQFGDDAIPMYFHHLLRSPSYKARIKAVSRGVVDSRLRLYTDDLFRMEALLPPEEEQASIVRYLNYAEHRIKKAIAAKQRLIKLLDEQKQAIVHRAVTRGLNPDVPMKPSGIEWLGDVPKHWTPRAFTRCAIERADYRGATPNKTESGVFLVTARNVRKGVIDYQISQEFIAAADYAAVMRRGLPKVGDVLLTMEAPLGNVALVDREDVAFAQRVVRFRLDERVLLPEFALNSMLSAYFQDQLLSRGTGSTALGIKASKLPQLQILCPPLVEQKQILDGIASEVGPTQNLIRQAVREIALLREYRARLIADVVTGKADVRDAAAHLPDLFESDERSEDESALEGGEEDLSEEDSTEVTSA